jgi:hypothetical protein
MKIRIEIRKSIAFRVRLERYVSLQSDLRSSTAMVEWESLVYNILIPLAHSLLFLCSSPPQLSS